MPDKPIGPLRQRMIDDMTARSGRAAPQASGGTAARAKGFGRRLCENVESAMIWEVVVGGW